MPDFSVSPGGFARGMDGSNVKLQLIVLEKYGDFDLPVGTYCAFRGQLS